MGSRVFLCLSDLLAHYGQIAPDGDAILAPGFAPIRYGALWSQMNSLACALRSLGIGPDGRVAIVLPEGPDNAIAMIAVACGAVCVPLNPAFVADEWQRYFGDLRITALLTCADIRSASVEVARRLDIPIIHLSRSGEGLLVLKLNSPGMAKAPSVAAPLAPSTNDAFVLLTSGTTSHPKIVPLTHAGVCRSAYNAGAALALDRHDRLLNVLPLFHAHGLISGLLTALAAGSSVVCTPAFDVTAFFGWLTEFRPTWYTAVPAVHRALLSAARHHKHRSLRTSLRLIRSASASLPAEVLSGLEELFGVPVIETYGMTEAASQIAVNPLVRRKPGSVGKSAGAEIAIIDDKGQRLPAGERGEILLRGPTITRGYENDPAATSAAFREGWFRTGDLGYLDEDGYLFIVGRSKDVINRGGQKVAPAEVEEALLKHPKVLEAVAFSIPHPRLGEAVAAAVVLSPGTSITSRRLRDFARQRLAAFKVPAVIRIVAEIPKSPAGKVTRHRLAGALSLTLPQSQTESESAAHRSRLQSRLARLWAELLDLKHVDIDQDVFALGADSFTLTQMLARLQTSFGVSLPIRAVFEAPSVREFARRVEEARDAGPKEPAFEVGNLKRTSAETVSVLQEHVLKSEQTLPGTPQFNLPFGYRLRGPLDVPMLERSLTAVMLRHEMLHTGFVWRNERPAIAPAADVVSPLIVEDLVPPISARTQRAKALLLKKASLKAEQEAWTPFDLTRGPLFRTRLLRLDEHDHVLIMILHHVIVDGWSVGIFIEELSALYCAFAAGRPAPLPKSAALFSDFVHWQHRWVKTDQASRQVKFWNERLFGASPVFATDTDVLGSPVARIPVHLSSDLVARLRAFGRSYGGTLFMTLLAAFKALVLLRTGRRDICIATAMANRPQQWMEGVIGPFENTTVVRTQIDPGLSFREALNRVRDSVLETNARQDLPFEIFASRVAEEGGPDCASLVQVFFALQNSYRRPLLLSDVSVQPFGNVYLEGQAVLPIDRTWLAVILKETASGVIGSCTYKRDMFKAGAVETWLEDYQGILENVAAHPNMELSRLVTV
jgi:acyl-CoA synthetase (AMP-forming)/AMP-acid ligase II/acyl carrier protein